MIVVQVLATFLMEFMGMRRIIEERQRRELIGIISVFGKIEHSTFEVNALTLEYGLACFKSISFNLGIIGL